jgi:hypothetical protein
MVLFTALPRFAARQQQNPNLPNPITNARVRNPSTLCHPDRSENLFLFRKPHKRPAYEKLKRHAEYGTPFRLEGPPLCEEVDALNIGPPVAAVDHGGEPFYVVWAVRGFLSIGARYDLGTEAQAHATTLGNASVGRNARHQPYVYSEQR